MSQSRPQDPNAGIATTRPVTCPIPGCGVSATMGSMTAHLRQNHQEASADEEHEHYGAVDAWCRRLALYIKRCATCKNLYMTVGFRRHETWCKSEKAAAMRSASGRQDRYRPAGGAHDRYCKVVSVEAPPSSAQYVRPSRKQGAAAAARDVVDVDAEEKAVEPEAEPMDDAGVADGWLVEDPPEEAAQRRPPARRKQPARAAQPQQQQQREQQRHGQRRQEQRSPDQEREPVRQRGGRPEQQPRPPPPPRAHAGPDTEDELAAWGESSILFFANHGPLVRNIPKAAMPAWRSLLSSHIQQCAAQPQGREWDVALLTLMGAAGALRRRRGGAGRHGLRNLINQILHTSDCDADAAAHRAEDGGDGDADQPASGPADAAAQERAQRSEHEEDQRAARRAAWLVGQGHASKAIAVLARRKRVVPLTPAVEERLRSFYPQTVEDDVVPRRELDPVHRVTFDPACPRTRAHMRAMLYSNAAAGPSGLTPEHLKCVLQDEVTYACLLQILERIANGEAGPAASAALLTARLLPLADVAPLGEEEPAEPKLRPIACGDILLRLASALVNELVKEQAVAYFGKLQQGCGAPGGAQAAGSHDLHALKGGHLLVSLDVASAFPKVARVAIARQLDTSAARGLRPAVAHARWLLGANPMLIGGAPGEVRGVFRQVTGIQQGCALSPFMFCLAIHEHLREAVNADASVSVCGYVDNASLAGPPVPTLEAAAAFIEALQSRPEGDMSVKWTAHHVIRPAAELAEGVWDEEDERAIEAYKEQHQTADPGSSPTALGVPLGTDEDIAARLVPDFDKHHGRCVRALLDKHNCLSTQTRLLLLRYLLNGAATHSLRVLPPALTSGLAQHLDGIATRFVEQHVLDVEHIPMDDDVRDEALEQARLRVSKGGLGFLSLELIAPVAYIAGFAQALQARTLNIRDAAWAQASIDQCWNTGPVEAARDAALSGKLKKPLLPESGELRALVRHFAHYDLDEDWDGERPWQRADLPFLVGDEVNAHVTRKLQKTLSEPIKGHLAADFRQRGTAATRARLDSAAGPGASAFLTCMPVSAQTTIGDTEFKTALRLRLGTPFVDLSSLPDRCVCKTAPTISANAYHLLACSQLNNSAKGRQSLRAEWGANTWNERHALIKQALATMLTAAGVTVIDEPGPLNDEDGDGAAQPMPDQLLSFISHGAGHALRRLCTDVTVAECNTHARVVRETPARVLDSEATTKNRKHGAAARKAGIAFVPLVASSLGTLHQDFLAFLKLDGVRLDDDHLFLAFGGRRAFMARLMDTVSCAIASGTAYVARVAAERLVFSVHGRHNEELPGLHKPVANLHRPPRHRARPRQAQERQVLPGADNDSDHAGSRAEGIGGSFAPARASAR